MNDAALYEATVPVFRHYVHRIKALVQKLSPEQGALLNETLAPHAFTAAEHLETALGFVSRTLLPLLDQQVTTPEGKTTDRDGLVDHSDAIEAWLRTITVQTFDGAATRRVKHSAGSAELEHDATAFVTLFALPNFFFHVGMAFAILRYNGVDIGKADFDGQHVYAAGFHF